MANGNGGVLRGPNDGDERKSGYPDGTNRRHGPRIDDADGAVVTFGSIFNATYMERSKMSLPTNARTSPDEEEETAHPPSSGAGEFTTNGTKRNFLV